MNSRKALLLLVPFILTSRFAQAGATDREAQARTARKACLTGDYTKGVAILTELFVDTEDPTYIYNQGRCFEQNLRYTDAIGRFQEYLRLGKKLTKSAKADAEQHIAECERLQAKQSSQTATAGPPRQPVAPAPAVAQVAPAVRPPEVAPAAS